MVVALTCHLPLQKGFHVRITTLILFVLVYGCSGAHSPVATDNIPTERVRLTAHQTSDEPLYEVYDFRWNVWNDSKSKVTENEPREIRFVLAEGSGLSALEHGYTTDVFVFANGEKDTIDENMTLQAMSCTPDITGSMKR